MGVYYNPKRTRNIFNPDSKEPFQLSRSKIDNFLKCPRCFYIDRRCGVGQPPSFPFNLNSAVDTLLKKEFDTHRARNKIHPLMEAYKIDAVPFDHPKMDEWRDALRRGMKYFYEPANLIIQGAVDDVWKNNKTGELIIVDYKATAKEGEVSLDADWQIGYKRQMELYQWLFRKNNFSVQDIGYFVYCNGKTDRFAFDGKLEFDVSLLPYEGRTEWVEPTLMSIQKCLMSDSLPDSAEDCDFCLYRDAVSKIEGNNKNV
ncbi:MAG: Uncharacterized protein LiPW41_209 [Parcubacteria group bacterium LiPW_41]|nr:MAG: Uncharacterized protein LiPW41_209 [Parcubacteria group bacterium LiPW_41]